MAVTLRPPLLLLYQQQIGYALNLNHGTNAPSAAKHNGRPLAEKLKKTRPECPPTQPTPRWRFQHYETKLTASYPLGTAGSQKITRANAACASVRLSPQTGACTCRNRRAMEIAGIAPPFVVHLGCIGAALLVGSKGLLVIKGQGGRSRTAQLHSAPPRHRQSSKLPLKMRIFRIALPQYLLFGSHYMSMRLITPCTACIGIL